jgi:hypothetical protein
MQCAPSNCQKGSLRILIEQENNACGEAMMLKEKRGGNLVAWETVMMPKEKGGLGVLNLRLQNDALLMKHLSKFYNRADVPWVQLVWNKYYSAKVPHAAREVDSF